MFNSYRAIGRLTKRLSQARCYSASSSSRKTMSTALLFGGGAALGLGWYATLSKKVPADNEAPKAFSTTRLTSLDPPQYASKDEMNVAYKEIEELLGSDNVSKDESDFETHSDSYFNTHHATKDERPSMIAYPRNTEEVSKVMKICYKYRVPIVPFSGGTSLEGHYIPTRKGLSIDFMNMDQVLQLNKGDLDVVVQPGLGWQDLALYLEPHNLMFGPDPGPGAEIGGMVGTSCSGTNAFRYGTMRENVVNLTVVLADGTIIKTRQRPRKSSAGYNLNGIFIGSEGTLGLVTEATLKLHPKPICQTIAVISFDTVANATKSVQEFIQTGIPLDAIELFNNKMMSCLNSTGELKRKFDENPTLFLKVGGSNDRVIDATVDHVKEITEKHGQQSFQFATNEQEKTDLWEARKVILWSTIEYGKVQLKSEVESWTTDIAVPISKLADVVNETEQDFEQSKIFGTIVGHVGDGNFHTFIIYKSEDKPSIEHCVERMVKRAIKAEGTCTGEHGIGFGKRAYLVEELGERTVDTMRQLKMALDPLRLLNPDKVFKIDPQDVANN